MPQRTSKKIRERIYLDGFLAEIGWGIRPEDIEERESPDFVLKGPGPRRFGVEVALTFAGEKTRSGSSEKEHESRDAAWLRGLCATYYDSGGPAVYVQMNTRAMLTDSFATDLCEAIRAEAEKLAPSGLEMKEVEFGDPRAAPLATMTIRRLPETEDFKRYSRWRNLNHAVGWGRKRTADDLQREVNRKAALLPSYHEVVPEVVLLLVADGFTKSGIMIYEGPTISGAGFSSVHLFHYPKGQVVRLA